MAKLRLCRNIIRKLNKKFHDHGLYFRIGKYRKNNNIKLLITFCYSSFKDLDFISIENYIKDFNNTDNFKYNRYEDYTSRTKVIVIFSNEVILEKLLTCILLFHNCNEEWINHRR